MILKFCVAMNMTEGDTLFKKRVSLLVIYEPGPWESKVDYCLASTDWNSFLKDVKVLEVTRVAISLRHWYLILRYVKWKVLVESLHKRERNFHEDSIKNDSAHTLKV